MVRPLIKKLRWRWKTCQAHLAVISLVYKCLLSEQWFYTISGTFLQVKSENMHRWNIFLIEELSMFASPQIKTVKPPDKKPGIYDKSFWRRRSATFLFVGRTVLQHSPGRAASKACWLTWFIAKYEKSFVCLALYYESVRFIIETTTCQRLVSVGNLN